MWKDSILDKHSAAPSAAGFLFQFRRALLALSLGHNGTQVGIETLDDVSILSPDGNLKLEQDKFTTSNTGRVFGDQSHNLLNTLHTWVSAVLNGEIDPATTEFYLVTNSKCTTPLVLEIDAAQEAADVNAVLAKIVALDGTSEDLVRLKALLASDIGAEAFRRICHSVRLSDEVGDSGFYSSLPIETSQESNRNAIGDALLGWLHSCALSAWSGRKPCLITYQNFINQLFAICKQMKRETVREKPTYKVSISHEDIDRASSMKFVRQVELVSNDPDERYDAITDYLKCITEKLRLSSIGEITDDEWQSFDKELRDRWGDIFRQTKRIEKELPAADVGYDIMSKTLDRSYLPPLAGQRIDYPYLSRGSYHRLADSLKVGWHPNYNNILGGK